VHQELQWLLELRCRQTDELIRVGRHVVAVLHLTLQESYKMLIIYSNYQLHAHKRILQSVNLGRDGDLNLDSRLQADAGNLLDNLAGRVQVDQSFVYLELIAIPSLRTFTTRSLTGGDLQNFGGEADRAFDTELLVLGSVNEIGRELLQVPNVAAGKRDPDFVDFCTGHWGTSSVVFFFTLSDVTHVE